MTHPARTPLRLLALIAALLGVGMLFNDRSASGDDIDLLRFDSGKPYVFIILDSSSSMNLAPDGTWLRAGGDDHRSRLHSAKKVLYEVFSQVTDVHYGFATFNQDALRVRAKHWLYFTDEATAAAADFPLAYPVSQGGAAPELPTCEDAEGDPVSCSAPGAVTTDYLPNFVGDFLTFGPTLDLPPPSTPCTGLPFGAPGTAAREKFNHYPKFGVPSDPGATTTFWLDTGGSNDPEYRLVFNIQSGQVGDPTINVRMVLHEVTSVNNTLCTASVDPSSKERASVVFKRYQDFLVWDAPAGTPFLHSDDVTAGHWPIQDAELGPRIEGGDPDDVDDSCGPAHPHSGLGWEGNYDGTFTSPYATPADIFRDPVDADACPSPTDLSCLNLMRPTELAAPITGHASTRPLDRGDLIPFSWTVDNQSEFLSRLAPDGDPGPGFNHRSARFFEDEPDVISGYLPLCDPAELDCPLSDPSQRPILALGPTQVANSINDFRCYWFGQGNKCNQMAYQPGFESIAISEDSEWGCRRPYVIVISDGGDNCPGASPCSETANFKAAGVQAWYVRYGNCSSNALRCITQNSGGESVCPTDPSGLKEELERILGQIREETRTFASAAVPSVQANAGQSVYLTNFRPINGESVWEGHIDAFLKPVPVDPTTRRPVKTPVCSSSQKANCFLWDAAEEVLAQSNDVPPFTPPRALGIAEDQRRIFYSRAADALTPLGTLSERRRLFDTTTAATPIDVRYDLWRGLDISWIPVLGDTAAQNRANDIVLTTRTVRQKTLVPAPPPPDNATRTWALGEIFHSNPIVVGQPENTGYFSMDLESDGTRCEDGNPGYRCFAFRHQYRRKMLVTGSNDGMLHVFDVGIFRLNGAAEGSDPRALYDNGTGRELFAYIPRPVLPTIKEIAEGSSHRYGVDLTPVAADVFIDPLHEGAPDPDDREWHTILVGGLREGGSSPTAPLAGRTGYFALDLTQPDQLDDEEARDVPEPAPGTLNYVPSCINLDPTETWDEEDCGTLPFASPLWEWSDSAVEIGALSAVILNPLDEDENAKQDLGETWSIPNMGRLRVCREGGTRCTANPGLGNEEQDDDLETRYVMVAGGGMDPEKTGEVGNWLYIVDVETGQTLYKRQLEGSAAAEPAAVDTNQDGYLDRIYIGTTAGYLYRADVGPADHPSGPLGRVPALTAATAKDVFGVSHATLRVTDALWAPRIVFDAGDRQDRAIFYPPSVAFLARLNRYVVTFGTGDREDLWNRSDDVPGRFYVFVDNSADGRDPLGAWPAALVEANLTPIAVDIATSPATNTDFLLNPPPGKRAGWFMLLGAREKLIAPSFALSGVLFFTSYAPQVDLTEDSEGNPLCGKKGQSRVFVVQTTNANPLTFENKVVTSSTPFSRHFDVSTFVTEPFTEQGQNANPTPDDLTSHADDLSARDLRVNQELRKLFPANCRFANNRIDVKTVSNDTEVIMIAPVPQCIIEKNWRAF